METYYRKRALIYSEGKHADEHGGEVHDYFKVFDSINAAKRESRKLQSQGVTIKVIK